MKLAVFYDYLETIGGGERVVLSLAKGLGADIVTTNLDPELPRRAGYGDVRVINLGHLMKGPPLKQIHASAKFFRSRLPGYDAYILVGNWAHFAARRHHPNLYYCLTPTRMFYDRRDAVLRNLPFLRRIVARTWTSVHAALDRRAVRHCDRIVGISEVVRERVQRYYGVQADVIYPPVATSRFHFQELGDFWLSVSRMYPEKRIELQLDIFRRLPNQKLVLVGGFSKGDRAERYVASLSPPPNVEVLGEVDEAQLVDLYARCRGFVTTAIDEDFGITPVEANAAGKVVLATNEGGYRETVLDGRTGFLLPPDPEAFAAQIRALDDATLLAMRDACVARARDFDESAFLDRMRTAVASMATGR